MAESTHRIIAKSKLLEEIFNSVTHSLGTLAATVGLVIGLQTSPASTTFLIGFSVFGISLILLMLFSTLYHSLVFTRASEVFHIFDQSSIYLLIAGTYTPFALVLYDGWLAFVLLLVMWSLAVTGIVLRASLPRVMKRFSTGIYITLGWLAVFFVPSLLALPDTSAWILLIIGGLFYTGGASLLLIKKPFIHVAWHVMVIAAATIHYFAILKLA